MRLANAFELVGAVHGIVIGHRVKRRPDGSEQVCRPWFAKWSEAGRERSASLKTTNKNVAIRKAMEIDQRLSAGLVVQPRAIGIEDLVQSYLESKRGERRAPKTLEKYRFVLAEFAESLPAEVQASAARLSADHFWKYSNFLTDTRKVSEHTWSDRLTIVKQLGRWAEAHGKLARNPFKSCKVPDPVPTAQPCFRPEQVSELLAAADGQLRTIVTVLVYAGLRFGELRELRWDHVDFSAKALIIDRGGSSATTKGRASRTIPMHPAIETALQSAPRRGERVFYQDVSAEHPRGENPLDERRLLRSFKRLCARAGLENAEKFTLHTCRHAFASMLARSNVAGKYGLALMGHKESEVFDRYVTLYDQDVARAIGTIRYPTLTTPQPDSAEHRPPAA